MLLCCVSCVVDFFSVARLFEWIFFNVHSEDVGDDERAVYLNGLHEILATDGGKSPHTAVMPVSTKLWLAVCCLFVLTGY